MLKLEANGRHMKQDAVGDSRLRPGAATWLSGQNSGLNSGLATRFFDFSFFLIFRF